MSRSLLLYFVKTKKSLFEKLRVKALSIENTPKRSDSLSVFTCNVNPSASWKIEGHQATATWIPISERAASGLLYTCPHETDQVSWSIDLECRGFEESTVANTTLSLHCTYENDQGVVCLPLRGPDSSKYDELYLYYLFAHGYVPPTSDCDAPRSVNLVPVRAKPDSTKVQTDPWPTRTPVQVGHAGAGVHRAHYGGGREWPENTICAFRRSEQLGLEMVECDATVTRDYSAVVLHHNFTVGFRPLPPNASAKGHIFALDEKPDGPINEDTPNLIVNHTLDSLRKLLGQGTSPNTSPSHATRFVHPTPLTLNDPEPDQYGSEGQPFPELTDVFRQTSTRLGFNLEMKYPRETMLGCLTRALATGASITEQLPGPHTYFAKVNRFCDKVLDVIWKNAGPRPIILSSFNADLCAVLRLKQSHFPVLLVTRGGIASDTEPPNMFHVDLRHTSLPVALSWAHMMNLSGVVTLGQHFGSAPALYHTSPDQIEQLASDMEAKQLSCFVYGDGVSELSFLQKATQYGLTGVIIDRVDSYMHEYSKSSAGASN